MTINDIRKRVATIIDPDKNAMTLAREFFKNGNGRLLPSWKRTIVGDEDVYKGYPYAAINARSNLVARTAIENIKTYHKKMDANEKEEYVHPYLSVVDQSPTFSNYEFWKTISVYLDLEGIFYLMAIRAFDEESGRYGNVTEFKLLNPYRIRRVVDQQTGELGGYVEQKYGMTREIPKEMIIEIKELNPFNHDTPYSMTDAVKDSQSTLITAGDYTRNALDGNVNAPGIITTDVQLSTEEFQNFVNRVVNHTKGEPIFGNGSGAIKYESMATDLDKAALKDVNEIGRDELLAVTGMSKTVMGIEQSGTTRETSRVQRELNMEIHILPRIQEIIDPLNQDYKNNYKNEYSKKEALLFVENPMQSDHEADIKEAEAKQKRYDLYDKMVAQGYDPEVAQKYVLGEIDLDKVGEPVNEPREVQQTPIQIVQGLNKAVNALSSENNQSLIQQQQGSLRNAVINAESQLVASAIHKITRRVKNAAKNDIDIEFNDETDIITKKDKNEIMRELSMVLGAFYGIVLNLEGQKVARKRSDQYQLPAQFNLSRDVTSYIKDLSKKVSESHVDTVLSDVLVTARESALRGDTLEELASSIRKKHNETITKTRAQTIARTETNRAFTRAQYEADKQFVEQNDLAGKVYKQWRTRSDNPCPMCESLAREGKIPFDKAFRNLGDTIVADGKTIDVNFESLEAGNAHPNCSCIYELIIEND